MRLFRRLVEVTKECLEKGIEAAIKEHSESNGYSVVRDFGGHGIGLQFQEEPFVCHYGNKGEGMVLVQGRVFTIEPMINAGDYEILVDSKDDWTVFTEDGSLSAQWENTLLVTEEGMEIISK